MSQTREKQRFTITEVAADWHVLMIRPLYPRQRTTGPAVQLADIPPPQSATLGFHPVANAR